MKILSDSDRSVDFTKALQGHVGQSTKQVFHEERSRALENRRLMLEAREHIVKDQFGNLYLVFAAKLMDGELYAVSHYISHPRTGLLSKFRKLGFRKFDDAMLTYLQDNAWVAFGKTTLAILRARQAAKLPMISALPSGLPLPI